MNETNDTTQAVAEASEKVLINDLDSFVRILFTWHEDKVQLLEHVLDVPEGTTMMVKDQDESSEEIILEGDKRKAFVAGLTLALMELGRLPFFFETDEVDGESLH